MKKTTKYKNEKSSNLNWRSNLSYTLTTKSGLVVSAFSINFIADYQLIELYNKLLKEIKWDTA